VNYDRPEWHLDGSFPPDLPSVAASTHIGMFLAWAIHRNLEGEDLKANASEMLASVRAREITGRDFFEEVCDGRLWSSDLSDAGNRFAESYYRTEQYMDDYKRLLAAQLPSMYHVEDSWENFDIVARRLDERLESPQKKPGRLWWRFW
jgi:hypothetical protein